MKYPEFTNSLLLSLILLTIPCICFSQNETIIQSLKNSDEIYIDYTQQTLTELICQSDWSFAYDRIDFEKNGIYFTGSQDTYEGKWELTDNGKIKIYPVWKGGKIRILNFLNTYTLMLNDSYHAAYYSEEYYEAFNDSKERKKEQEIELSDITADDILGIWVTDEQGPMGELLGFRFFEHIVYFGRPGLEMLFGCWDDVEYKDGLNWTYNDKEKKIIIEAGDDASHTDNIIIKISEFYKEAFSGSISPDFVLDESGSEDEREFWKSNCYWDY